MLASLQGCAIYNALDPCQTTHYSGNTPEERAAQMPRYCGPSSSSYRVTATGPGYYASSYVTVSDLNWNGGQPKTMTDEQLHNSVYGPFKTDKYGRILNWNEVK